MHKRFIKIAAIVGAFAVAIGAFGAHALKQSAQDDVLKVFETAVRYQFYHVFALLGAGILYKDFPGRWLKWAGIFFFAGIILFSGSLYFVTYGKVAEITGLNRIGAITPIGGLFFIMGWICLLAAVFQKKPTGNWQ